MRILEVSIQRFRGFEDLTLQPEQHVALVGEPRAGRSDLVEALRRVLTVDGVRQTTPSELDLWMLDREFRAEVSVVLGDLGPELEQDFLDHLEAWDPITAALAEPLQPTQSGAIEDTEWVVRLCYRIEWSHDQEQAVHWVDFPNESDPGSGVFTHVPRRLLDLLPVVVIEGSGRPLRLSPRAVFRRILEDSGSNTLGGALDSLVDALANAGDALAKDADVKSSAVNVLKPVEGSLGSDASTDDILQFVPEGGSLSGILRSLQPALDLGGPGHLPLYRHGATADALLQAGEALAATADCGAVVLLDDFGEGLDSMSARHLASLFRKRSGQVWISTRRSAAVEPFGANELVRLFVRDGSRRAAQLGELKTKAERIAARHLTLQLLPAASASAVAILEGPHDRAALDALANELLQSADQPLPSAHGIALIDAGVVDGSGGATAVARLAALGTRLGFHIVGVIDGDPGEDGKAYLAAAEAAADRVVRLPDGAAIEVALIADLSAPVVVQALRDLCSAYDIAEPPELDTQSGGALLKSVISILKKNGGLHAQFLELLPAGTTPPLLRRILDSVIAAGAARLTGLDQL